MPTVSSAFGLGKTQPELDFVNVSLRTDNQLFLDPFAITQHVDRWSQEAGRTIGLFFQQVVDFIRTGAEDRALELLSHLREPNETRLGYSKHNKGAGVGAGQAEEIFSALQKSSAVRTGFITALEEAELLIPGIGRDKISDLTTNIIRHHLAEYTALQCDLHGIPRQSVSMPPCFNPDGMVWESRYLDLPVFKGKPLILVPKAAVRYAPAYQQGKYYQHFVLSFLQQEELANPASRLVKTLKKDNRRVVYKKDLSEIYPNGKEFLFDFSRKHPKILAKYREELKELERTGQSRQLDEGNESLIAEALIEVLRNIPSGDQQASTYHKLMVGVVEFLFYPSLVHPRKEREIHDGRKRIDIVMENSARTGVFLDLPNIRRIPSAYIAFECKNYGREVGNPELDQIAGRFGVNRGMVGFLCCRTFDNRKRFIDRCRDTFRDGRGLVLPLDDTVVIRCLELVQAGARAALDEQWSNLVAEITLN